MRKLLYLILAIGFTFKGALAQDNVKKYENYLNSLKSFTGQFTQLNSRGQEARGKIQISRPGKMRLTYAPPSSLVIVSDGKWLLTHDKDGDQVDYVSLENTPAAFILRPNVRFSGDVEVTNVIAKGDTTDISLIRTDDPDAGFITLVFENDPISLKEWSVVDPQGVTTRVVLSNLKYGVSFPPKLFHIESPDLINQIF